MVDYLGTDDKRLSFQGEFLQLDPLTSDPASTETGDMWLRSDLAPETDQIATVRFETDSGTRDIPVFQIGTSTADIEEVLRVPIGGQVGYIPIAARDDAAYADLSFFHNNSLYGFHNAVELPAIPNSAVHQYDATQLSLSDDDTVSTWSDEVGSADLTGTATYKTGVQNGNPVVRFNGVDDFLDISWSTINQPFQIIVVSVSNAASDDFQYTVDGIDGSNRHIIQTPNGGDEQFGLNAGSSAITTGFFDNNWHIHNGLFTSTSVYRIDGTEEASGSGGTDNSEGITVGAANGGGTNLDGDVGEIIVYDGELSSSEQDSEEQRLADKWGITI